MSSTNTATTTPPGTSVVTSASASSSGSDWGYAFGGGVEWAFGDRLTLRGEYLYLNLDDNNVALVVPEATATSSRTDVHIVRAALNFLFR